MSITNGYTDLTTIKARAGIPTGITTDDSILEAVVTSVSRSIDEFCGTRFYVVPSEARVFTAHKAGEVLIDDCVVVVSLTTDGDGDRTYETTWATTDYDLMPFNATVNGKPFWKVKVTPNGRYSFPLHEAGVKITGSFGYASATPAVVSEACLIQSLRIFKRKDSPFGAAGSAETGMMRIVRLDMDVQFNLGPMRRISAA